MMPMYYKGLCISLGLFWDDRRGMMGGRRAFYTSGRWRDGDDYDLAQPEHERHEISRFSLHTHVIVDMLDRQAARDGLGTGRLEQGTMLMLNVPKYIQYFPSSLAHTHCAIVHRQSQCNRYQHARYASLDLSLLNLSHDANPRHPASRRQRASPASNCSIQH